MAHIVHWRIAGNTLAPLEFSEVVLTVGEGIVTAGFLFMSAALLSVLLFGRFFCSWLCHMVALQDLCTWLLTKLHIRPKPIRSRLLFMLPLALLVYLFVPLRRLVVAIVPGAAAVVGEPPPFDLRFAHDVDGWASFSTQDFWRNLPGPWIAVATFFVCGFLIVYVLGSRSLCRFVCPYGALFGIADRFALGHIKLTGDCAQCATCTATCKSDVRVHQEVVRFGRVVDPGCLKDLDCVSACPEGALSFGYGRPNLFTRRRSADTGKGAPKTFDFQLYEEIGLLVIFCVSLAIFSGFPDWIAPWSARLYGELPLFLAVTLAALTAVGALLLARLGRRRLVRISSIRLKVRGRIRPAGWIFIAIAALWLAFVVDSALVQYHMFQAAHKIDQTRSAAATALQQRPVEEEFRALARDGKRHLRWASSLGLLSDHRIERREAWLSLVLGDPDGAAQHLRRAISLSPDYADSHYQLGRILAVQGRFRDAARVLADAEDVSLDSSRHRAALRRCAEQLVLLGMPHRALGLLDEAYLLRPNDPGLRELGDRISAAMRNSTAPL